MIRREIFKAAAFLAIGALAGGYAVAYLWWKAAPTPSVESAVSVAPALPQPAGNPKVISRKEFKDTLKKTGLDGLTRLIGSPDKLGPPGHVTQGPCWIYLRRTYATDPNKRDASAYVFRYENGAIDTVEFHDE